MVDGSPAFELKGRFIQVVNPHVNLSFRKETRLICPSLLLMQYFGDLADTCRLRICIPIAIISKGPSFVQHVIKWQEMTTVLPHLLQNTNITVRIQLKTFR